VPSAMQSAALPVEGDGDYPASDAVNDQANKPMGLTEELDSGIHFQVKPTPLSRAALSCPGQANLRRHALQSAPAITYLMLLLLNPLPTSSPRRTASGLRWVQRPPSCSLTWPTFSCLR
jgi:hypothetical protein